MPATNNIIVNAMVSMKVFMVILLLAIFLTMSIVYDIVFHEKVCKRLFDYGFVICAFGVFW